MTTEAPVALRADACPEPEQLAAYIDGTLAPAERTTVERHLVDCADCRDVVGETVVTVKQFPHVVDVKPSRWKWVAAGGGVLAAAAAVLLVVQVQGPRSGEIPELTRLAQAVGQERVIEPRLTGG